MGGDYYYCVECNESLGSHYFPYCQQCYERSDYCLDCTRHTNPYDCYICKFPDEWEQMRDEIFEIERQINKLQSKIYHIKNK